MTWTDHVEAALLRDALIAHKIENVMLVSAFMAAAALTQAVGDATNYARTALLFVEPYTATLAVVDTCDGSISDVHRRVLADDEDLAVAELVDMVSGADALEARPEGVVVVGSGVDIPLIKPALEAATALELSAPDEPEMALARARRWCRRMRRCSRRPRPHWRTRWTPAPARSTRWRSPDSRRDYYPDTCPNTEASQSFPRMPTGQAQCCLQRPARRGRRGAHRHRPGRGRAAQVCPAGG